MRVEQIEVGKTYYGRNGKSRDVDQVTVGDGGVVKVCWVENAGKWGWCAPKTFARWAVREVPHA